MALRSLRGNQWDRGGLGVSMSDRRRTSISRPLTLICCRGSLGLRLIPPYADFFRREHGPDPFGASLAWVATTGERTAGLRLCLR